MLPYSVYIHIPFCSHRCGYCDFNTYAGLGSWIPDYVQAVCQEMEQVRDLAGEPFPVHTIFFGGGTPSLLSSQQINHILEILNSCFSFQSNLEITLEANPGTVTPETLNALRSCGINRLSLGVQSVHPRELHILERRHDFIDVIHAVSWARQAGFDNINLDLIYGIPYQTLSSWSRTLAHVTQLHPDHLSLYALTLEDGTVMKNWMRRGLLEEIDPDLSADMYEAASRSLEDAGFVQYEISNWGRRVSGEDYKACRHNLQYWRNHPYFGFGAGAHGYVAGFRIANVLSPVAYIERLRDSRPDRSLSFPQTSATIHAEKIDRAGEMSESMILGLRLTQEGISDREFSKRFAVSLRQQYGDAIEKLCRYGLLEWTGDNADRLRLTKAGRLLGNQVFVEFV